MKPPTQAPGGAAPRRPVVRVQYRQATSARTTRWQSGGSLDPWRSVLAILLVFSLPVAVAVGSFTIYGSAPIAVVDRTGGLRWEFFYEPALVGAFGLTVDQLVRTPGNGRWK